jgi:hypothetical protein
MNISSSRNAKAAVLQVAILALLGAATPAVAQSNGGTTTNTTAPLVNPNDPLLKGSDLTAAPNPYNGMGEPIPVRKDAWTWYWSEKAHLDIDPQDKGRFWGDDAISDVFRNISNNFVIPFWNGAMEYDFIRGGLLVVIVGMLLGLGASVFLPKKPDAK